MKPRAQAGLAAKPPTRAEDPNILKPIRKKTESSRTQGQKLHTQYKSTRSRTMLAAKADKSRSITYGSMPERLKGADCKSAGAGLRWFESGSTHFYQFYQFYQFYYASNSKGPEDRRRRSRRQSRKSFGKVAEWFNASVLKTDVASTLPGVRIPPFP